MKDAVGNARAQLTNRLRRFPAVKIEVARPTFTICVSAVGVSVAILVATGEETVGFGRHRTSRQGRASVAAHPSTGPARAPVAVAVGAVGVVVEVVVGAIAAIGFGRNCALALATNEASGTITVVDALHARVTQLVTGRGGRVGARVAAGDTGPRPRVAAFGTIAKGAVAGAMAICGALHAAQRLAALLTRARVRAADAGVVLAGLRPITKRAVVTVRRRTAFDTGVGDAHRRTIALAIRRTLIALLADAKRGARRTIARSEALRTLAKRFAANVPCPTGGVAGAASAVVAGLRAIAEDAITALSRTQALNALVAALVAQGGVRVAPARVWRIDTRVVGAAGLDPITKKAVVALAVGGALDADVADASWRRPAALRVGGAFHADVARFDAHIVGARMVAIFARPRRGAGFSSGTKSAVVAISGDPTVDAPLRIFFANLVVLARVIGVDTGVVDASFLARAEEAVIAIGIG